MANKKQYIQQQFIYGETGERISGFRTSEIYNGSAKQLRNLIITDVGTVKVATKFVSKNIGIDADVVNVGETSSNTYIVLTKTKLYLVNKSDDSIKNSVTHSMGNNVNMSLMGKEYVALYSETGSAKFKIYNVSDLSQKTDFNLTYPIKSKKTLELSVWRISKDPTDSSKLRCVQMYTFSDPKLKIQSNQIYLTQSDIKINRIYVTYNSVVDADYFSDAKAGDLYGIMRITYATTATEGYIIGNTKVTLGSLTNDTKYNGKYFTTINGANTDGVFTFGNLVDISAPERISFYQDRAIYYSKGYLYFSKINEYFDVRNSTSSDSPFFIQLNPINNTIGELVDMVTGNGLFVLTTAGIYLIGYGNSTLTPSTISSNVSPITDMGCSKIYTVIDGILYFINSNNILKAVSLDRTSSQLAFSIYTVDKYSSRNLFKDITNITIEDKTYVLARSLDNKVMYLIESIEYSGVFRKVSLDFDFSNRAFGLSDRFIIGNTVYKAGQNNYEEATILMNPPTLNGNSILADNSSTIQDIAIKFLNEDNESIKGIVLNSEKIQNIPSNLNEYNIYRARINDKVGDGYSINIFTNGNNKICELQTIQLSLNIVEDL